jgi:hypothetical protein
LFFANFYSLPLVFGRTLFLWIEPRGLADVFGGCWAGIRRLSKKIENSSGFTKSKKSSDLFIKSTDPFPTTPKPTVKDSSFDPRKQIAPKHQRYSGPNESGEKRTYFLNNPTQINLNFSQKQAYNFIV